MARFSVDDQRRVLRAVRRGEAVDDPRLDQATVALARSMDTGCVWGTLFHASWLVLIGAAVVTQAVAHDWEATAKGLVAFDFFALAAATGPIYRKRARASERATMLRTPS